MRLPGLRGISPPTLIKHTFKQLWAHDLPHHSAAVTYYVLFSLFPFVIFFIALLGFLELSQVFDWLRNRSQEVFLQQSMHQINHVLDQLQQRRRGMLSLGALGALALAARAMLSMMKALNVVYGVQEERPFWKRYCVSILYTLILGSMIIVSITMVVVAPQALQVLAERTGVGHSFAMLWAWWLRWPLIALLLTVIAALIYRIGPDVEQRFRFVTPGSFVAVFAWMVVSVAFNFYVHNFAHYDALYGSVGTLFVLLLYFYLCSFILLAGAEFNAAIEQFDPTGKNAGEKKLQ